MFNACVIGTSAGGLEALKSILSKLENSLTCPIIIVQHLSPRYESYLPEILNQCSKIPVVEIEEKEDIQDHYIYVAPANYHVLIEKDFTFSLTTGKRVSYARPSIDILFETAADAYKENLLGLLLTGANHDGATGLKRIHDQGGYTLVQDPKSAYAKEMPESAIKLFRPNQILELDKIGYELNKILDRGVVND